MLDSYITKASAIISVIVQLNKLRDHVQRWKHVTTREFTDRYYLLDMIPSADRIAINKLGDGGTNTTDTCNAACKLRRLLVKAIGGCVNERECMK